MVKQLVIGTLLGVFLSGCSAPPSAIPGIPKDHPANQFYQYASSMMISDRSCSDYQGSSDIPMGEIAKGEKYTKLEDLAAGVFRFHDNTTGKQYLAVSYMRREGFLQLPQACAWEEPENK
jgi:hypothetical protein